MLKIKNNLLDIMHKNKINHLQLVKLLEKQGFSISPSNITRYTKENCPSFSLELISALCLSFDCTPNDIFTNEVHSKLSEMKENLSCECKITDTSADVESASKNLIEFDVAIGPTFDLFPFKRL